ncbi:hypothetical protein Y1Q_0011728 [Alligator mississippiensis]|uniref:Uncharacterized protein n=1 Tax=Alligator mississippiensis TaxID=8496 RepID=A0A151M0W5_ALLMI|nr:hypothetical protein Y1Q_0011728 [Alligator mississippiensis]
MDCKTRLDYKSGAKKDLKHQGQRRNQNETTTDKTQKLRLRISYMAEGRPQGWIFCPHRFHFIIRLFNCALIKMSS